MSCERYAAALREHAMGAPLDRAAQAHLDTCAACRARLEYDQRAMAVLDEELAGALTVEPSSDFQAQVRVRIANEPAPARFWPHALVLTAAASIVMGIGVILLQSGRHVSSPVDAPPRPDAVLRAEAPHAPVAGTVLEDPRLLPGERRADGTVPPRAERPQKYVARSFSSANQSYVARSVSSAPLEPEVIVLPDRADAIRRYVIAVAEGRVEIPGGALPEVTPPASVITPLTVEPIVIPPFESRTSTPTVRGL